MDRKRVLNGVYEPHTNVMHYPATMQPSHARWEHIPLNTDQGTSGKEEPQESIFAPLKPLYQRNFLIVDTVYENPTYSNLGVPGPGDDARDVGFKGLSSVPDDLYNELPADCKQAFDEALEKEKEWKSRWSTEGVDQMRRAPVIDKGLIM